MAYAPGKHGSPEFRVGVDVMNVKLPERTTFASFVQTMSEQESTFESKGRFSGITTAFLVDTGGDQCTVSNCLPI
jgi:hypothetical protein